MSPLEQVSVFSSDADGKRDVIEALPTVSADDFEVWACKLNIFVEFYLRPAYEKRKQEERIIRKRNLEHLEHDGHVVIS